MKLLMISTDKKMFQQGSAVSLRQIETAKKWEEVHIIVFTDKSFREVHFAPNVWVYPTRSGSKFMYAFDAKRLGKFLVKGRGITHVTTEDSSLTAMAGLALKKQFKIQLEINVHTDIGSKNFTWNFENKVRKAMALSYLPQADSVRVVSPRIKKYLTDDLKIEEGRITVRPIAVDADKIKNSPVTTNLKVKYVQFTKVVLVASRLEKEKNVRLAIEAWPQVLAKVPRAGLVIVGSGRERERLEALVDRLGIAASVKFEDWADEKTLISYYKTADVFLNTSLYEGYGMTLAEAKAAGTKIVSTDVGIAKEAGAIIAVWKADDVADKIVYSVGQ
jgi:glycosyltransferase involved in cell wall biosynthesis